MIIIIMITVIMIIIIIMELSFFLGWLEWFVYEEDYSKCYNFS